MPPLTPQGRAATSAKKYFRGRNMSILQEAILDPDKIIMLSKAIQGREKGEKLITTLGSIIDEYSTER